MGFFFNTTDTEEKTISQADQIALGQKYMEQFSKASGISIEMLKQFYGKNAKGEYSEKIWNLFLENIGFSADVVGGKKANASIEQLSKAPRGQLPSKYSWTAVFTQQGHTVTFEDLTKAVIATAKQTATQVADVTAVTALTVGSGLMIYKIIGLMAGLLAIYKTIKQK